MVSTALGGTVMSGDKLSLVETDILAAGGIGKVRAVLGLLEVSRVLEALVLGLLLELELGMLAAGAMGEMEEFTFFLFLFLREIFLFFSLPEDMLG